MADKLGKIKRVLIQRGEESSPYLQDESHLDRGYAEAIYFPGKEDEVCDLLAYFNQQGTRITVSGARTGVVGGALPLGGIVISMERMDRLLGMRRDERSGNWVIKLEPGVRLQDLQKTIENTKELEGYFYPPDPTEGTAMMGGTVAANSSGARSYTYGPTRDYVHRLRVALVNGDILDISRGEIISDKANRFEAVTLSGEKLEITAPSYLMPQVKNAAGYYSKPGMDLIDLFIGSEGTLGIITYLELRLLPRPKNTFCGLAFLHHEQDAFRLVSQIRQEQRKPITRIKPATLEYFDLHSLELLHQKHQESALIGDVPSYSQAAIFFEQFCQEEELGDLYEAWQGVLESSGVNMDETWGGFEERDLKKMKEFRHSLPEILNELFRQRKREYPNIHKVSVDICVPGEFFEPLVRFCQAELMDQALEYVLFGHMGEYHLHLNILPRTDQEMEMAGALSLRFAERSVSLGGTVSAEHGIGKLKHKFLEILYSPKAIKEMVQLKLSLDPKGILNRGNIFSEVYLV